MLHLASETFDAASKSLVTTSRHRRRTPNNRLLSAKVALSNVTLFVNCNRSPVSTETHLRFRNSGAAEGELDLAIARNAEADSVIRIWRNGVALLMRPYYDC